MGIYCKTVELKDKPISNQNIHGILLNNMSKSKSKN